MDPSRITFLLCIILTMLFALNLAHGEDASSIMLLRSTVVDPEALHLPGAIWNTTVNGMAFQQAALASHNGWQYTTWWDAERRLCIARRPLPDGEWESIRFEDYHIESDNTHCATVLGISGDGVIHLSFDHHGHDLRYRFSEPGVTLHPEEIEWTAELFGPVTNALRPGELISGVTYPRFVPMNDGGLQLMYRRGGSGNGDWLLATYREGQGWTAPGVVITGTGAYGASESRCAYLHGIAYEPSGRLHLSWVWRETPDPMSNHDMYYAYSDDEGATWANGAGEAAGVRGETPMGIDTPGIRFQRIDMYRGLMNSTTQVVDSQSRVHIVNFHLPDETPSQLNWAHTRERARYMHYWRDNDGLWQRNETDFMGTRPQLFADSSDNLYLVTTGDRYYPDRDLVVLGADAAADWTNWREVYRVPGPFTGQPQLDRSRGADVMAVYLQEYPEDVESDRSALRVFEFQVGSFSD